MIGVVLTACAASHNRQSPPLEFNILEYGQCKEGGLVSCTHAITAAVAAARAAVVSGRTHEADVVVPTGKVCGSHPTCHAFFFPYSLSFLICVHITSVRLSESSGLCTYFILLCTARLGCSAVAVGQ